MQKLGLYEAPTLPSGRKRTKARTALLMTPPDLQVRSSFEVGDTVYLTRGARPKVKRDLLGRVIVRMTCNCQNAGSTDIERSDHSAQCNKSLDWIVRVTYTTLYGNVAHMDSVRLCMADAARLRVQYGAHVATVRRVYPLRLR